MRETLTEWIVDDACRIASQMHHKGLGALAINASGHELMAAGFRDIIANALNRYRLPPSQLVVEVTETVFVDNSSALFTLQEIADLGVRIALDDFGTGFSSLNHLRQMPAPIVKLDRSYTSFLHIVPRCRHPDHRDTGSSGQSHRSAWSGTGSRRHRRTAPAGRGQGRGRHPGSGFFLGSTRARSRMLLHSSEHSALLNSVSF